MRDTMGREEILITRLDEVFQPNVNLSPYGLKDTWHVIPARDFKRCALEYYELGVDGIALRDAMERQCPSVSRDIVRRFGHTDELAAIIPDERMRYYKIYRIAGMEINRYFPDFIKQKPISRA